MIEQLEIEVAALYRRLAGLKPCPNPCGREALEYALTQRDKRRELEHELRAAKLKLAVERKRAAVSKRVA